MKLCIGCNKLTRNSRCEECQRVIDRQREARRGKREHYSGAWSKISRELRAQFPYCQKCGAQDVKLEVHHIKARSMELGLMVLCVPCHAQEGKKEDK